MKTASLRLLVVLILALGLAGCSSDDDDPVRPQPPTVDFEPGLAAGKTLDDDIDVTVQAAHDGSRLALRFRWATNKNYAGIFHDVRHYDAETNTWIKPASDLFDAVAKIDEDRVALMIDHATEGLTGFADFGCFIACHSDLNRMPNATVDARHYVIPGDDGDLGSYQLDMWHWRGSRAGPMGYAEDTWVRAHEYDSGAQGRRRDEAGPDGNLRRDQAFDVAHTVTINGEQIEIDLPQYVYDPELNHDFYFLNDRNELITEANINQIFGEYTIARMEAGTLPHALIWNGPRANALALADQTDAVKDEIAREALAGGLINRPWLVDSTSDQHDITSDRTFDFVTGIWTVTMYRALDTGSAFDVDLAGLPTGSLYTLGISIHDSNDGGRSHQVSAPVTLGTSGADIVAASVSNVEAANWGSIPGYTTTTFKPGDMSYQFLNDQADGHPVALDRDCMSCHVGFDTHPNFQPTGNCMSCHDDGTKAFELWDYAPYVQR